MCQLETKPLGLKFQGIHEKVWSFAKEKIIPGLSKEPEWGSSKVLVALCLLFFPGLYFQKETVQYLSVRSTGTPKKTYHSLLYREKPSPSPFRRMKALTLLSIQETCNILK